MWTRNRAAQASLKASLVECRRENPHGCVGISVGYPEPSLAGMFFDFRRMHLVNVYCSWPARVTG